MQMHKQIREPDWGRCLIDRQLCMHAYAQLQCMPRQENNKPTCKRSKNWGKRSLPSIGVEGMFERSISFGCKAKVRTQRSLRWMFERSSRYARAGIVHACMRVQATACTCSWPCLSGAREKWRSTARSDHGPSHRRALLASFKILCVGLYRLRPTVVSFFLFVFSLSLFFESF